MRITPRAHVHVSLDHQEFSLIAFICNPDGLSVTSGQFAVLGREEFETGGFEVVKKMLADYLVKDKEGPSEFDKMLPHERIIFFKSHIGFAVSERRADLWEIDPMRPIGDGSLVLSVGPTYRVRFNPSNGAEMFYQIILALLEKPK